MTAELLRRAADAKEAWASEIEALIEGATPGPWRDCPMGSEGSNVLAGGNTIHTARKPATCREFADAAYIAALNPEVGARLVAEARAVATWLRTLAQRADEIVETIRSERVAASVANTLVGWHEALTVARAILGEEATA